MSKKQAALAVPVRFTPEQDEAAYYQIRDGFVAEIDALCPPGDSVAEPRIDGFVPNQKVLFTARCALQKALELDWNAAHGYMKNAFDHLQACQARMLRDKKQKVQGAITALNTRVQASGRDWSGIVNAVDGKFIDAAIVAPLYTEADKALTAAEAEISRLEIKLEADKKAEALAEAERLRQEAIDTRRTIAREANANFADLLDELAEVAA